MAAREIELFADTRSRRLWFGGAAALSAALILLRLWVPFEPAYTRTTPKKLIAQVPADLRTKPVFNAYGFGGPLILAGIKPYIDGRADMYGDRFVLDFVDMTDGDMAKLADDQEARDIAALTGAAIQRASMKYLDLTNYVKVTLMPEGK